jgi:hypothetical protein
MKHPYLYHYPRPSRRDRAALFLAVYGVTGLAIFAIVAIYHALT